LATREPIPYNLELFQRDLEPEARGVLWKDFRATGPDDWGPDKPALNSLARAEILKPEKFDGLPEDNKFIVVALVRHVVDVLNRRYVRKEPGEYPDMSELEAGHLFRKPSISSTDLPAVEWYNPLFTLYLSTEGMWDELLRLASTPGAGGAQFGPDPAVRAASGALTKFLENGQASGNIVAAHFLEQRLEHGRDYYEDPTRTATRSPVLNMNDLDSDLMHAFLCAYATCFRPSENSVQNP
jgi:hypothetical protein